MKRLLKIGMVLVVLVLLAAGASVVYVVANVNLLAKAGIEKGGTFALGVPTTVKDVDLHILRGEITLGGLNVANPVGFAAPSFLALGKGDIAVTLGSLRSDVVDVPRFKLDGITVNLERKGSGANYKVILDNLQKLKSTSGTAPSSGGSEKKLIIRDLELTNIRVHADLLGVGGPIGDVVGAVTKVDVPIERIQMNDVGRTGTGVQGTGVTVEQLTSIIVQAVFAAAAEKGGGILPADILGDLRGGVASLGDLGKLPVSVVGKAGETAAKIGEEAAKAVGETAGKAIDEVGKTIGEGLGGLIPGTKKEEKKK